MTTDKRKVLGRGLETLLPPRHVPHAPVAAPSAPKANADEVHQIALESLEHNPYQTRTLSLDSVAIGELASSIQSVGVVQPIVVRPVSGGAISSHRGRAPAREASRTLGLKTIPAIVRQVSNEQAMEMTIIENLQREDLNAMEQARAYERLGREFGLTQEQMAQTYRQGNARRSRTSCRLLSAACAGADDAREEPAKLRPCQGTHAAGFAGGDGAAGAPCLGVARMYQALGTEEAVSNLMQPRLAKEEKARVVDPNVKEAEKLLERSLGVRVTINDRKGKGKILIEYSSLEDFDRIVEALSDNK